MQPAFGRDLSDVRIHTGSTASRLSNRYGARALTVGNHVAFAAGEYRPGTPVGDALMAHELAHVVQQRGSSRSVASLQRGSGAIDALEQDADSSAAGVVASLWQGVHGSASRIARNAVPSLRSGLRLQRCPATQQAQPQSPAQQQQEQEGAQAAPRPQANCSTPSPQIARCRPTCEAPRPVFDRSGGRTETIDGSSAQEFSRNITTFLGNPHVAPEFIPDAPFDFRTNARGGRVRGSENITSIGLTVKTPITKVRFGMGRPNAVHRRAIQEMVACIEEHEREHRAIIETEATCALCAAQRFVGTNRVPEAERTITTGLECTTNRKHEQLDAVEGLLTVVEGADGAVRIVKSSSGARYPCP